MPVSLPSVKPNWKELATKAWSLWALYASILIQAVDTLMPFLLDYTSPTWLKGSAFAVTCLAIYVRMMPQRNLPGEP